MIGLFITSIMISLVFNLLVIIVLASKSSVTYFDVLMISLASSDFAQTIFGYSVEINSYMSRTAINSSACKIAGFSTTFFALVSIAHFAGIAVNRTLLLKCPWTARRWMDRPYMSMYIIIPSWLYGFFWSVLPLLGWSSYKRANGAKHRCSIDFADNENHAISYAISLLAFCFILPVVTIVLSNTFTIIEMKKITRRSLKLGANGRVMVLRRKTEARNTYLLTFLFSAFLVSWTPYTICVLMMVIEYNVSSIFLTSAAIFAKTSTLYNPIGYFLFMHGFRRRCFRLLKKLIGLNGPRDLSTTGIVFSGWSSMSLSQLRETRL